MALRDMEDSFIISDMFYIENTNLEKIQYGSIVSFGKKKQLELLLHACM